MATVAAKFECTLLGHKERSFDVRFSENGSQLLSGLKGCFSVFYCYKEL